MEPDSVGTNNKKSFQYPYKSKEPFEVYLENKIKTSDNINIGNFHEGWSRHNVLLNEATTYRIRQVV